MTYVVSDMHGNYDLFLKLLQEINFSADDHLYILGDVIDRGPKPIQLLQEIMKRDNITLLYGNHDYRMLECISFTDFSTIENAKRVAEIFRPMNDWMYDGGEVTIRQYCALSDEERKDIKDYLSSLDTYKILKINGKSFFISHTAPYKEKFAQKDVITLNDLTWGEIEYDKEYFTSTYLVSGHTPTVLINHNYRGLVYMENKHIAIDCGCFFTGILGCVCLDTLNAYYVSGWDGKSFKDIFEEITGIAGISTKAPLCTLMGVNPEQFKDMPIGRLTLSDWTDDKVIESYFKIAKVKEGKRVSIQDLLGLSIDDYTENNHLSNTCFAEFIEGLKTYVKCY